MNRDQVRPTKDQNWLHHAKVASELSTCLSRKVGAVVVNRFGRLCSTGRNGPPKNEPHCVQCKRKRVGPGERLDLCPAQHADSNAMLWAGASECENGTLYIWGGTPCIRCAGMVINAGIKRVVANVKYPDQEALELLARANIEVCIIVVCIKE